MKKIILILIAGVIFSSCGNKEKPLEELILSDDAKILKDKKEELVKQQQELAAQIKKLDIRIEELSPEGNVPKVTAFKTNLQKFTHFVEIQGSVATKQTNEGKRELDPSTPISTPW